ncbi:DNA polymerase III subunit gamma/tau [Candidatus Parcubacteria bacterium]|nr:DNA polymerase III subunit gamma/tau [Candidatus Parcubacteria bacterium]
MTEKNNSLYQKYRPNDWGEVLGQNHVIDVLEKSIANNKISHAYLFFGTRGTGKTSTARIFAEKIGVSGNDLYEIDAASNTGVDNIRELRESVHTLPFDSPYKIYILDEVHMLSKSAFNALLKTLEEPPKHVIFILATTELHKVPDTVISRCQLFTFKKPTELVLTELAQSVAKKEGVTIDKGGAELVALLGDGSFRDTLGILQKVLSYSTDKKIEREEIEKVTGAPSIKSVQGVLRSLTEGSIDKAIEALGLAQEAGVDIKVFGKILISNLRTGLLLRYAPDSREKVFEKISESDKEFFKEVLQETKGVFTSKTLLVFLDAYLRIDSSFVKTLPLELAIIEILGNNSEV